MTDQELKERFKALHCSILISQIFISALILLLIFK